MNNSGRFKFFKGSVWPVLFAFLLLLPVACTGETEKTNLPLSFPFDVHEAGNMVESDFVISEKQTYAFELEYFFKKGDRTDRARVWGLVGGPYREKAPRKGVLGKEVEMGAPLQIRLKIKKSSENKESFIFSKIISNPRLTSWGANSLNAKLTNIMLDPGKYKFIAENMNSAPEFQDVRVNFVINRAYLGK